MSGEHALSGFKPTSKTVWESRPGIICKVRVLNSIPSNHKDNCGALSTKFSDPEKAAEYYRKVKSLPDDWPVRVTAFDEGVEVGAVILPPPREPETPEPIPEPEATEPSAETP